MCISCSDAWGDCWGKAQVGMENSPKRTIGITRIKFMENLLLLLRAVGIAVAACGLPDLERVGMTRLADRHSRRPLQGVLVWFAFADETLDFVVFGVGEDADHGHHAHHTGAPI